MDLKEQQALLKRAQKRIKQKKYLFVHLALLVIGSIVFYILNKIVGISELEYKDWYIYASLTWLAIWVLHFINMYYTQKFFGSDWEKRETALLIAKHNKKVLKLEKKLIKEGVLTAEDKPKKSLFSKKKKQVITIIAAIADNNALGKDNKLIWHLPADLKRFKALTTGHHIIMGRKTYASIGKPLPNRTTVIITRDQHFTAHEDCIIVNSLEDALDAARKDDNPFIIGGAQIYKLALPIATKLDITRVHHTFDADVFFPEIDNSVWEVAVKEDFNADDKNKYEYSFVTYIRK